MNEFSPPVGTTVRPTSPRPPCLLKPRLDTIALPDFSSQLPSDYVSRSNGNGNGQHTSTQAAHVKVLPGQIVETELTDVYHYARPAVMPLIWVGQEVWLVRKPENYHDSNAIAAYRCVGKLLGYINRDLAADLAPYFDGYGLPVPSRITALTNGYRALGIHIKFIVPLRDLPDDTVPPPHTSLEESRQLLPPRDAGSRVSCDKIDPPPPILDPDRSQPLRLPTADAVSEPRPPKPERTPEDSAAPTLAATAGLRMVPDVALDLPGRPGNIAEVMERAAAELRWLWIEYQDAWGIVTQRRVLPLARYTALNSVHGETRRYCVSTILTACGVHRVFAIA